MQKDLIDNFEPQPLKVTLQATIPEPIMKKLDDAVSKIRDRGVKATRSSVVSKILGDRFDATPDYDELTTLIPSPPTS